MSPRRLLAALALLLVPAVAAADPVSIVAFFSGATAVSATVLTVAKFAFVVGLSAYGGMVARRAAKRRAARARADYNANLSDRTVTALTAAPPLRYVLGRCVVGCDLVGIFTSDKVATKNNGTTYTKADGYKHLVAVFAGHEVHALHEVFIGGKPLHIDSLDADGWVTTGEFARGRTITREIQLGIGETVTFPSAPTIVSAYSAAHSGDDAAPQLTVTPSGNAITNPFSHNLWLTVTYQDSRGAARVSWHLGTASQTADTYLTTVCPSDWGSTDRLRGLAYAVITLDLEEPEFQGGPPAITFDTSGLVEAVDPRTSTAGYTENPAVLVRWFLMAPCGLRLLSSEINTTAAVAAANACDVDAAISDGSSWVVAPRYTCNGTFTSADDPEQVLDSLCASMAGWAAPSDQWIIQAGAWAAPVLALTADDQAGPLQIVQHATGLDDTYNSSRASYIPRGASTPAEADAYTNAAYLTDDGEELWADETFPFTDNPHRVRNLQRINMEQARGAFVIAVPFKLRAWPLQPGDRITFGNPAHQIPNDTTWVVTDWQNAPGSPVQLTLQLDTADMYDEADAPSAHTSPVVPLPNPWAVPNPASVAAQSGAAQLVVLADGTVNVRARVTWAQPGGSVSSGGRTEVTWRRQGSDAAAAWQTLTAQGAETGLWVDNLQAGQWLTIGVAHINALGTRSDTVYIRHAVAGKDDAPANVASFASAKASGEATHTWAAPTDADYAVTELRATDADWGTPGFLWQGTATQWRERLAATGSLTRYARHRDTSGNYSATAASATLTITAEDLLADPPAGYLSDVQTVARRLAATSGDTRLMVKGNGEIWVKGVSAMRYDGNYHAPTTTGLGAGLWVRATTDSSSVALSGDALGTWLPLTTDREWTRTRSTVGIDTANVLLLFATDADGANVVCRRTALMEIEITT